MFSEISSSLSLEKSNEIADLHKQPVLGAFFRRQSSSVTFGSQFLDSSRCHIIRSDRENLLRRSRSEAPTERLYYAPKQACSTAVDWHKAILSNAVTKREFVFGS